MTNFAMISMAELACSHLLVLAAITSFVTTKSLTNMHVGLSNTLTLCIYLLMIMMYLIRKYICCPQPNTSLTQTIETPSGDATPSGSIHLSATPTFTGLGGSTNPASSPIRWWIYPMIAIVNQEAILFTSRALGQADFVSVALVLLCIFPIYIVNSSFLLGDLLHWKQALGCFIIVSSSIPLLLGAYGQDYSYRHHFLRNYPHAVGIILAVLASFLFGTLTVMVRICNERMMLQMNLETFGKLAMWGGVFSVIQAAPLEIPSLLDIEWTFSIVLCCIGYIFAVLLFYISWCILPIGYNTSRNAACKLTWVLYIFYTPVIAYIIFHELPNIYTIIGFIIILSGFLIYFIQPTPLQPLTLKGQIASASTPNEFLSTIRIEKASL